MKPTFNLSVLIPFVMALNFGLLGTGNVVWLVISGVLVTISLYFLLKDKWIVKSKNKSSVPKNIHQKINSKAKEQDLVTSV